MSGGVPRPALVGQERVLDAAKAEVEAVERSELVARAKRLRKAIDGAAGLMAAGVRPTRESVIATLASVAEFLDDFVDHVNRRGPGPRKAGHP